MTYINPTKHIDIDINTIQMQLDEPLTDLYIYRDFNRRKTTVYANDEIPVKLNIEKLAKRRLNITDYWNDILDVGFKIDKNTNTLRIIYETT